MKEKEIEQIVLKSAFEHYRKLLKWLYDNHKEILREWEKHNGWKSELHFLESEKEEQ